MDTKERKLLWQYYEKNPQHYRKATCQLCKKLLSYQSSITKLKTHLRIKHPSQYAQYIADIKASTDEAHLSTNIPNSVESNAEATDSESLLVRTNEPSPSSPEALQPPAKMSRSLKLSTDQKKKIDDSLINLLVVEYLPFSMVEDAMFCQFVKALNATYDLPSKKFISSSKMPILHIKCLREKRNMLIEQASSVSVSVECWTSTSSQRYVAVSAHFINKSFKRVSVMLRTLHVGHAEQNYPSGLVISIAIEKVIEDWYLKEKITFCTTEKNYNLPKAMAILGWEHVNCFASELNKAVTESIKLFEEIINKVKEVVSHFLRSYEAMDLLMEYQTQFEKEFQPKKLITGDTKRWESTYSMLKRFSELENALKVNIPCIDAKLPTLTEEEWIAIREICIVLQPFEEVVQKMSTEGYLRGSMPIVLTNGLLSVFEEFKKETYSDVVVTIIDTLNQHILKCFAELESNETLALCTLLDPRFKEYAFADKSAADVTRGILVEMVQQRFVAMDAENGSNEADDDDGGGGERSEASSENRFSIWKQFQKTIKAKQPVGSSVSLRAEYEVETYLKEPLLARNKCPLEWWRNHRQQYSNLSDILVQRCHAVVTSVPCERLYTEEGRVLADRRARVPPEEVEQLAFLNANYLKNS